MGYIDASIVFLTQLDLDLNLEPTILLAFAKMTVQYRYIAS